MFRDNGMEIATLGPDNRVIIKPVTIGRDLGNAVQIVTGITKDDKLINNPPDSLRRAMRSPPRPPRPRPVSPRAAPTGGRSRHPIVAIKSWTAKSGQAIPEKNERLLGVRQILFRRRINNGIGPVTQGFTIVAAGWRGWASPSRWPPSPQPRWR